METNKIFVKDSKVYTKRDHGLYTTWEQLPDISVEAETNVGTVWKGAKMPFTLWEVMAAFLRWSQVQFKSEAMMTLFYNKETGEWAAWAFAQETNGMTVMTLENHETYKEDREKFGKGWIQLGSIHHHCNAGAFQSGTDTKDEIDRDGLHITLGKMNDPELDTHFRQVFSGNQSTPKPQDWIDIPEWLKNVPAKYHGDIFMKELKSAGINIAFPEVWKGRVIEKKAITYPHFDHRSVSMERDVRGTSVGHGIAVNQLPRSFGPYRETCRNVMKRIIAKYKITAEAAYALVETANVQTMPSADLAIRVDIMCEARKEHVPPFWAEELLLEISVQDKKDAIVAHNDMLAGFSDSEFNQHMMG